MGGYCPEPIEGGSARRPKLGATVPNPSEAARPAARKWELRSRTHRRRLRPPLRRRAERSGVQAQPRRARISLTGPRGNTTSKLRLPPGHTHSWACREASVSERLSGRVPKRTPHWRQEPTTENRARDRERRMRFPGVHSQCTTSLPHRRSWTPAPEIRYAMRMRPTRPPDERRARHESTGEWPQPNLSTLLENRARSDPDGTYLIEGLREGGRRFSFHDVEIRARRMAVALRRLGVRAGDVVSWQLPNWMESAALAAAIDRLGAVSNPIISIYREREVGFVCRQAGSQVLVVPGEVRGVDHRELASAVRTMATALEHVVTVRAEP